MNTSLSLATWLAAFCVMTQAAAAADFYVATNGKDAWSGRLAQPNAAQTDGPFATLSRARDAARAAKAAPGAGAISVEVRGGTYYLTEPLTLGPDDSGSADRPIVYAAAKGEEVVLSGGRPITNWRKAEGGLWVANLPDVKAGKWYFRQLFVDGERQIRARTPNFDPANPVTGGWNFVPKPAVPKFTPKFGTCLACIHTPGDTFTWDIDVPARGEYAVWLYYGAKNEPFGRKDMAGRTSMQVDDGDKVVLQNLPDTGGWGAFKWSRCATLELTKGRHVIRWTNLKGGGLNWDAFALCDDPGWKPKRAKLAKPAAGKHVIIVQTEAFTSVKAKEFKVSRGRRYGPKDRIAFKPGDVQAWPRSPEPEVHIFPAWGWVNAIASVDHIDMEKHLIFIKNKNCSQDIRPGNRYFVENVFEALDSPGEWYLDRAEGRLYYWPRDADFAAKRVVAPALDRVIDVAGDLEAEPGKARFVEHVTLSGFTVRHTTYSLEQPSVYTPQDASIWLRRARACEIEGCRFLGVGGYAVRLSDRACDNEIVGNTVAYAGQGGVLMVGYTADQPKRNLVAGNAIHHCGQIWKHVAGVYVTTGSGNRIAHNTITDMPRYGVSLKSFGATGASHNNVVEYNRLLRTNLETNDTGAIETLGRDREDSGNVIRYNLILDVVGLKTSPEGEVISPHYTWGIYLDDYSSGTTIVGNIVARTVRGAFHVHLGRNNTFENNIFVDAIEQQGECNGNEFMANNKLVRNIFYFHQGNALRVSKGQDQALSECDYNVYWLVGGDMAKSDEPLMPRGAWAQWRALGYDAHSVVADPLFADPANDDYSLRSESPALALGFKPIDVSKIGVRGWKAGAQ